MYAGGPMGSYGERLVVGKRGQDAGRRSPPKASNEYNCPKREMVAAFVKSAGPFVGPFWCHVEKPRKQLPWSVCRPELSARSASHQRNTSEKESKKRLDKKKVKPNCSKQKAGKPAVTCAP